MSQKSILTANPQPDPEQEEQLIREAFGEPVARERVLETIRSDEAIERLSLEACACSEKSTGR